ncbi:methylated-DNA--[protein]-cysteine S-methyltransferase [Chondromyces crocatus]|uniref:Methylated-DNA--protein-cysteine methyltransferase n=1 Tax=Chondromyces crocatus TaxID=52 RepID=A0A0K1EK98_CHOCO|nr:methylated-DNA--[protein]-cysteine S-methyltransferase [Chondromyces crocatus]AKT41087.1 methylated-DNA--protein-cysteine methyltransferase [Chondromyces crocatus]
MIRYHLHVACPLGLLRLDATDDALAALYTPEHRCIPALSTAPGDRHPALLEARRQLAQYFAGDRLTFDLPLAPQGTPFQRTVWTALTRIPFGVTTTYAAIATQLGRPTAARAVGAANGQNPLSIIVPCHRVIGANGALTGYAGGLPTKRWLLTHETAMLEKKVPGTILTSNHATG